MSKAKLEEAVELVAKYELFRHDGKFIERVAALIDEVRGVDAEPAKFSGICEKCTHRSHCTTYNYCGYYARRVAPVIPAPSQPAAPVELPVVGDSDRLEFVIADECQIWECNGRYAVHAVTEHHPITAEFNTPREAIDAAIAAAQKGKS